MKAMKKIVALGLAAAFSLTLLAGCGGGDNGENTKPTIQGVPATASVVAGNEWNALAGVTASDKEDGNLTSKIEVKATGLTFTDGKVTPTADQARETPYTVNYTVKDSKGETAKASCKLTVEHATSELVNVYEADFSDVTPEWHDWDEEGATASDNHWWKLEKNADGDTTPEAAASLEEGMLKVDVTDLKSLGDDKLMLTRHFGDLDIGTYKFVVWIRSSVPVKINMQAILDEADATHKNWDGLALGNYNEDNYHTNEEGVPHGKFGADVGTAFRAIDFDFSITEKKITGTKAGALFRIALGGNGNPNAFKLDIEKITIWKTVGSNTETDLFTMNSSVPSTGGLVLDHAWEEAAAAVAYDATEQAVKIDITKYNTNDGIWTIVAKAPLTGATLEAGKRYGIEVQMKANTEIKPEVIVAINDSDDAKDGKNETPRFLKDDVAVGNSYVTIKSEFDGFATTTPYLFFQLGKNNDTDYPAVDANAVFVKSVRLFEVADSEETDIFTLNIGAASSAPKVEITKAGDGADSVTVGSQDGATTVNIGTYNTSEGCWSIIATIPLTGVTIDTEKTYGYAIEIKADNAFDNAEMHCGPQSNTGNGDKWYGGDIGAIGSEYRTLYHTFKFDEAYSAPALHLFLGKAPDKNTATSNVVYIKSFRFFEVKGNEKTTKMEDKFAVLGDEHVSFFNQSDDVFDAAPMGTAYLEDGKLVYLIHQGGTDWGHNKLAIGNWDNPVGPLPANAYYVVSFKIKASVAFDFSLTLHDLDMGWDEAEGGIPIRYADYGGHEPLHAGTTETTIEVVSPTTSLVAHNRCELLIEFGKLLGNNKDVRIEISDLTIGYRTVQA